MNIKINNSTTIADYEIYYLCPIVNIIIELLAQSHINKFIEINFSIRNYTEIYFIIYVSKDEDYKSIVMIITKEETNLRIIIINPYKTIADVFEVFYANPEFITKIKEIIEIFVDQK